MILTLIAPLLFSSVFYTETLKDWPEETQQTHTTKENEVYKDTQPAGVLCSCVDFVRQYRPELPSKNASDFTATTNVPATGKVALMFYPHSGMYHLALVTSVGTSSLEIAETNYVSCEFSTRHIELPHSRIIGYM